MSALEKATEALSSASSVLCFTGAGLSTESGIPDFRGPDGLWTKVDPDDFTIQRWLSNREIRSRGWQMHLDGDLWGARSAVKPNEGHMAIVRLASEGRLAGVVTQNVDGLHHKSGLTDEQVAELHGNVRNCKCLSCGQRWPTEVVLQWIEAGDDDPHCPVCAGMVKTETVLFGEMLPEAELTKAGEFLAKSDALLVLGSTVSVWPAADVIYRGVEQGKPLVVINKGETSVDEMAVTTIDDSIGSVLPPIVEEVLTR